MVKRHFIIFICASLGFLTGCITTPQGQSATEGAIIGATAGAIIGAQHNRPVEGAFVGGVLGGLAGAVLAEGGGSRVVASEPRYHRRACDAGYEYFEQASRAPDLDRKIRLLREGLRLCPDNPAAHNDLGVALVLRGDYAEARIHFRRALDIDPDYLPARQNLQRLRRIAMPERRRKIEHHHKHHDEDGYHRGHHHGWGDDEAFRDGHDQEDDD